MQQSRFMKPFLALASAATLAAPHAAQACGDMPYTGEICVFAFSFCPPNFLPADGSLQQIRTNNALFALLGTTYGGDGVNTFGLPDLRGRMIVGAGSGAGLSRVVLGQKDGQETITLAANQIAPHSHSGTYSGGTASGNASLPLTATVSGQTLSGALTVNALNGDNPPSGGANVPDSAHNTLGRMGVSNNFYPPSASKPVAVPVSQNLKVSDGNVAGNATGTINNLAVSGGTVTVAPNAGGMPVATMPPRQALTVCIVANGIFPSRP